jgi:hypothetical protein
MYNYYHYLKFTCFENKYNRETSVLSFFCNYMYNPSCKGHTMSLIVTMFNSCISRHYKHKHTINTHRYLASPYCWVLFKFLSCSLQIIHILCFCLVLRQSHISQLINLLSASCFWMPRWLDVGRLGCKGLILQKWL